MPHISKSFDAVAFRFRKTLIYRYQCPSRSQDNRARSKICYDVANVGQKSAQVRPQPTPSRPHIAFDRLHVTLGWPKLAPRWPHETPSWHQDRSSCAQVGLKMGEVGPKTVQSTTDMAPGGLKFASSWPQDCMKADISQTCIKPTNSFGKQ